MTSDNRFDWAVIGGGIVGCATAMTLGNKTFGRVIIIEAEDRIAAHQTGNNSGVIHSGLYYRPDSLKAKNCVEGREAMFRFCAEHDIPHERCGKLVVALTQDDLGRLADLEERGRQNGLLGIRKLCKEEIRELEPNIDGIGGLLILETGIVDYLRVAETYAALVAEQGGEIRLGTRFLRAVREPDGLVLETSKGEIRCGFLINCGGLQSDRIARRCKVDPKLRIVPFRGEYFKLNEDRAHLVKNLVYPVPDPRFPFLGVHFTRMIGGGVEAGPNAVLALKREGYKWQDISIPDMASYLFYSGFWKMALRYGWTGLGEVVRSLSKRAFVRALRKLVPALEMRDIKRGGAGVRAQALDRNGRLVDDFRIVTADRMIHVLNAPSPAATASLSIAEHIVELATREFNVPSH
jgi:L-2-hydroxyglutarate oxidase